MTVTVEEGYKVVSYKMYEKNIYRPAVIRSLDITYKLGKRTFPPFLGGPLTVFESISAAERFLAHTLSKNVKIFRCEYAPALCPALKLYYHAPGPSLLMWDYRLLSYLRANTNYEIKMLIRGRAPCMFPLVGTRFARWVRLLEEVY